MVLRSALAVFLLTAFEAAASEPVYPKVEWDIDLDLRFRRIYTTEGGSPLWDFFSESSASGALLIAPGWSVRTTVHAEPGTEGPTRDNFFENTAVFLEQLYLDYQGSWFTLQGGKFNPRFGIAFARTPGAFNKDFTEEYEFEEGVGLGGSLVQGHPIFGVQELAASFFFFDNSPLSLTLGQRRFENRDGALKRRNQPEYGGVGNTRTPRSWTLSLDGSDIDALPGLYYRVSYSHLARGEGDGKSQRGFAAGLQWDIPLAGDFSLQPLVEYAAFRNDGGLDGINSRFLTLATTLQWRAWSFSPVYVQRRFNNRHEEVDDGAGGLLLEARDPADRYVAFSIGHKFDEGPLLLLGWKDQREEGRNSQTVGLRLVWGFGEGRGHAH